MLKLSVRLLVPFLFTLAFVSLTKDTNAAIVGSTIPATVDENTATVRLHFTGLNPTQNYDIGDRVQELDGTFSNITPTSSGEFTTDPVCGQNSDELKTSCGAGDFFHDTSYDFFIRFAGSTGDGEVSFSFDVAKTGPNAPTISPSNPAPGDTITVTLTGSKRPNTRCDRNDYEVYVDDVDLGDEVAEQDAHVLPADCGGEHRAIFSGGFGAGNYLIRIDDAGDNHLYWSVPFTVAVGGGEVEDPVEEGEGGDGRTPGLCEGGGDRCNPCPGGNCETAIGSIPTGTKAFAERVLQVGTGLAGGLAFILMVIGAIRILVSQGDPQKLNGGREMMVAAVAGLLFLIFSIIILRFIGINIINIPGP